MFGLGTARETALKHILKLTSVVALFGLASGLVMIATPEVALKLLHLRDSAVGLIGTGMPLGYALSCLLCGQIFRRFPGKYVLLGGCAVSMAACVLMTSAESLSAAVTAQLLFGLAGGAFWPFASAWMLDFQSQQLGKTSILRCYNIAWTSGTMIGMYGAGLLCRAGLMHAPFYAAALSILAAVVLAGLAPATRISVFSDDALRQERPRRVGKALLLAAVSANLLVLATRAMTINTYAELNLARGFEADRMGLLTAASLGGQLLGFLIGRIYEPALGRRSMYTFVAVCLVAINLSLAKSASLPLLVAAMLLCGVTAAIAFQTAIIAAIEYFRFPRTGTTFHEAMVGLGGMGAWLAGEMISRLREAGYDPLTSLQAPFLSAATAAVLCLLLQLILISARHKQRVLLPAAVTSD